MNPFGLGMLKLCPSRFTGNRKEFGLGIEDRFTGNRKEFGLGIEDRLPANKKLKPFGFKAVFLIPCSIIERLPI
jgi:hypothetical protein